MPIQPDYRADRSMPSTMKGEGGMGENNGEDVVYLVTTRELNLNRKESYSIKIK
jgi:hypothetical protein